MHTRTVTQCCTDTSIYTLLHRTFNVSAVISPAELHKYNLSIKPTHLFRETA